MGKLKRLKNFPKRIRKITGGKDPTRLVQEFISRRSYDADEHLQQRTSDSATWLIPITEEEELEITLEGLSMSAETTLYMGINVASVPLHDAPRVLAAALSVADTLIGAKLSLVNYDLVLSITVYTADMGMADLDYYYELITRQKPVVQDAVLLDEMM